jgi:hypothetical protein
MILGLVQKKLNRRLGCCSPLRGVATRDIVEEKDPLGKFPSQNSFRGYEGTRRALTLSSISKKPGKCCLTIASLQNIVLPDPTVSLRCRRKTRTKTHQVEDPLRPTVKPKTAFPGLLCTKLIYINDVSRSCIVLDESISHKPTLTSNKGFSHLSSEASNTGSSSRTRSHSTSCWEMFEGVVVSLARQPLKEGVR